ncbi:VPLPA-CTERM sorting domain-containing protein [Roseobacter sp. OBYS 0001]|uniref:VPLPA-CTERM sorting domain-containing protein n=1 Tax=Roseobacter sp. OBYS 0001 TaxID=882651 RepID=UPI001BC642C7|nr:VPLPA-CTERM sorting domain-containing protein [Roseobacter sp. OBYS 0001]GIT88534.1 hypothetical protein ROBYS_35500 [Roseobacter sp. OBYS 0001]
MFKKSIIAAAIVSVGFVAQATAATLNGTFTIDIYQGTGLNSAQSSALKSNLGGSNSTLLDTITYTGDLDFSTNNGTATTIESWLNTGGGTYTLNNPIGGLTLSEPSISNGTARTTWFDIFGVFASGFDSMISHDDGISVFDDGVEIAEKSAPTTVVDTAALGFNGGEWNLLYAATNSDPSVLKVTGDSLPSTVPLPAGLPLLLAGLGTFAWMRRRKAA